MKLPNSKREYVSNSAGDSFTDSDSTSLNGIGDRAARRVPGLTAEEYLVNSVFFPEDYLVPAYGALMPTFGTEADPMPVEDLVAIVSYLCTVIEANETPICNMDNVSQVAAEAAESR